MGHQRNGKESLAHTEQDPVLREASSAGVFVLDLRWVGRMEDTHTYFLTLSTFALSCRGVASTGSWPVAGANIGSKIFIIHLLMQHNTIHT